MSTALKLALAVCVALGPCASGAAQTPGAALRSLTPALQTLRPFRPYLTASFDYTICAPFRKAWTRLFDSKKTLDEDGIDIQEAYPSAQIQEDTRYDIDGDGDLEFLEVFPYEIGWRNLGNDLFVFQSEDEWNKVMAPFRAGTAGQQDRPDRDADASKPWRVLFSYRPTDTTRRFVIGGHLYTMSHSSLYRVDGVKEPQLVCTMDVDSYADRTGAFLQSSSAVVAARDVYGYTSDQFCTGTMGWTGPPLGSPLPAILHRPWLVNLPDPPTDGSEYQRWDAGRDVQLLFWGISDPQSWRDYLELHGARGQLIADLRAWYVTNFSKSESEAQALAEHGARAMFDTLLYAAGAPSFTFIDDAVLRLRKLPFTADSSPVVIVRELADWVIANRAQQDVTAQAFWAYRALTASIYTRQPIEIVRALADEWRSADLAILRFNPNPTPDQIAQHAKEFRSSADALLLAALGHKGLTDLVLDLGADPGARTNGFGKTMLMYAAQGDQLNAVQLLLSRRVDVNAVTSVDQGAMCNSLDRDHRTALMYAAENASPPVIDAILAAGADVSAKDTKGNTALWYFGRNVRVSDSATRARFARLLGS